MLGAEHSATTTIPSPVECFKDSDLRKNEATTNTLGLPPPCAGNFADDCAVQSGQTNHQCLKE